MDTTTRQPTAHTCHGAIFCGMPRARAEAECPACTHANPHVRRTSVYTLRFLNREQVQQAADALTVPINDRGDFAVSWRDRCDADAIRHADKALAGAGLQDTPGIILTTGLGIHRRLVATV